MNFDQDNEFENAVTEDLLESSDELTSEIADIIADDETLFDENELGNGRISLPDDSEEELPFDMWSHPIRESQFDKVTVNIASPDTIRSWSHGEVKNPETINYRTYKPEPGGLFCQYIFGPVKDWECACGKYKSIKYEGIVCDRCGVEVTESKVRRERMGHIELAVPVAHIWFFKTMPSRLGAILDMTARSLERIIYFETYVILDPGRSGRKKGDLISEEELDKLRAEGHTDVKAGTGAEALEVLLKEVDLDKEAEKLYEDMLTSSSRQYRKKIAKRLKIIEGFRNSESRPEYMMIRVLPVLPPDLRPLVPLDGGRFATSDLNDLYRRVINRNNRTKALKSQRTPDVIINNEKRMLQEAVDALIDNGRHGRIVTGPSGRALKSLSDNLKGKQGRFRQNLLGKRVDYSGRSVIVVGPELKMTQCGLPKKMALQLFEPFIIRELKKRGIAQKIKAAKKVIERGENIVWDILEQVTKGHVVMLNRAPTLHRLGIQAFEPILIEGNAIRVHPLVCGGFNADFDGDQMAVHVPLSREALWEAKNFMMAPQNLFSPASGKPIMMPTQDIVLGIYYLTHDPWLKEHGSIGDKVVKAPTGTMTPQEVHRAYDNGVISLHHTIRVLFAPNWKNPEEAASEGKKEEIILTTAGRVFFNELLPKELKYYNETIDKKGLSKLIMDCFEAVGAMDTVETLDRIKEVGFHESTRAGFSISTSDMMVPPSRYDILSDAQNKVDRITKQFQAGVITEKERYNSVVDVWTAATITISEDLYAKLQSKAEYLRELNPLHMMVDSGARGSRDHIKQLVGMRGLMANTSGEIIETPIRSNFKEGLSMLEYFISSHGARKGLADTALKTADAGYLTRRLVDVAHDIIVTCNDCHTPSGITVSAITEGNKVLVKLSDRIKGRTALYDIVIPGTKEVIVKAGELITFAVAKEIEEAGIKEVAIRSVLNCEAPYGVCAKCYGMDLSKYKLVEEGTPVGIIAAQSISERGMQLTLDTHHLGGIAHKAEATGKRVLENVHSVNSEDDVRVSNEYGKSIVKDITGGLPTVEGLFEARPPKEIAEIAEIDGVISISNDIIGSGEDEGKLFSKLKDKLSDMEEWERRAIIQKKKAYDTAKHANKQKYSLVKITNQETGEFIIHKVSNDKKLLVTDGDYVQKGQELTTGELDPRQLLEIVGIRGLQGYLLDQIREVYRSQGAEINDKHIEVILRQMLRKVRIIDSGDTEFLYDDYVERSRFDRVNRKAIEEGKRPAKGMPLLQGITKAGLSTSSFISAASFQETTRVLTEAAATGREDPLLGFQECIIMGHLVPSGTGFSKERFISELDELDELDLGYTAQSELDSAFLLDTDDNEGEIIGSMDEILGGDFSSKGE